MRRAISYFLCSLVAIAVVGCGSGGSPRYAISIKVAGLSTSGTNLVLQNNNADDLTFTSSALNSFSLTDPGDAYNVSISQQPGGSYCLISNASGTVASNILINVTCSTVGYSWSGAATVQANTANMNAVANNGTTSYVAVGDTDATITTSATILYSSSPAAAWTRILVNTASNRLNDVVFDGSQYIAVGNGGRIVISGDGFGNAFSTVLTGITNAPTNFKSIATDNSGNVVAVGGTSICHGKKSKNNAVAYEVADFDCTIFSGLSFNEVAYNSSATNKWVAVADEVSSVGVTRINTASNGQVGGWGAGPNIGASNLTLISTIGSKYFVRAVSTNNIFTSSDGASWGSAIASTSSGSGSFIDIVILNSILYAIDGVSDKIYISGDNGSNWIVRTTSLGFDINDLLISDSKLIAVGDAGKVFVSQ